jgi:hypothetical protein
LSAETFRIATPVGVAICCIHDTHAIVSDLPTLINFTRNLNRHTDCWQDFNTDMKQYGPGRKDEATTQYPANHSLRINFAY